MKTFQQSFMDIDRLAKSEHKPPLAMFAKLGEEFGETGEALNITLGYITHKTMKEPLVGEIADLCQVALSLLVKMTPELSSKERMDLFLTHLERKNMKWAEVQRGEEIRALEAIKAKPIRKRPSPPTGEIERRVFKIVQEQLGLFMGDVTMDGDFVDDMGADSLDLVELAMAMEDEFDLEIPDEVAENTHTPGQTIRYLKEALGFVEAEVFTSAEEDADMIDDLCVPSPSISPFLEPITDRDPKMHFDPASDYTDRSGRHLTLSERMQERSRYSQLDHGGMHEEF
jgi:acyl carrier protein